MVRVIAILLVLIPFISHAAVYEIVEPDFVETAKAFARTEEFKREVEKEQKRQLDMLMDTMGEPLQQAVYDDEYEVEYYYTLSQDMPKVDRDGNIVGILYPKGYTFAPLKYMKMAPPPLIVYNPCDEDERELVNLIRSVYDKNYQRYMLITSGCSLEDMSKIKLGTQNRFLLDKDSIKKFNLKYTVSVVTADIVKGVFNVKVFAKQKQDNKSN